MLPHSFVRPSFQLFVLTNHQSKVILEPHQTLSSLPQEWSFENWYFCIPNIALNPLGIFEGLGVYFAYHFLLYSSWVQTYNLQYLCLTSQSATYKFCLPSISERALALPGILSGSYCSFFQVASIHLLISGQLFKDLDQLPFF